MTTTAVATLSSMLPAHTSAEHFYCQAVPGLDVPGIGPIYGLQLAIWQLRPADLQHKFPLNNAVQRFAFLAWCAVHGRREYKSLQELTPFWENLAQPATIKKTEWSGGISRLLQLAIAGRPDLNINPNLLTTQDQIAALRWYWLSGGYQELDQSSEKIPYWQKRFLLGDSSLAHSRIARLIYASHPKIRSRYDIKTTNGQQGFIKWMQNDLRIRNTLLTLTKPSLQAWPGKKLTSARVRKKYGVNLIGYAYGELGIGEDVRMAAHALRAAEIPFTIINIAPGDGIRQEDRSVESWVSEEFEYAINIVCLTALEHLRFFLERGAAPFRGRYTIGYWPWELQDWPTNWTHCFSLVDEVWASSKHIERAVAKTCRVPVIHMPMAVNLPDFEIGQKRNRARFGLPEKSILFVFSFDGNSFIERKNPLAIIYAFRAAFPAGDEAVGLVIKCMRPPIDNPIWQSVLRASQKDSRIILFDTILSKKDVTALYHACDCFVSLHRAEGFGRGIAEALLMGLNVIATDYGGNVDFCKDDPCAQLVPYKMKQLEAQDYVEAFGQRWADPDIEAAAEAMRQVVLDRSLPKPQRFYLDQRQRHHERFSPASVGARYRERISVLLSCQ